MRAADAALNWHTDAVPWSVVEQAQRGDPAARARLYQTYRGTVQIYLLARLHDWHAAEDLVQETFLRAYRRLHLVEYRGRDFGTWLVAIARNLVVDHLRGRRRRPETSWDDVTPNDFGRLVVEGPERAALAAVNLARIEYAMRALTPDQRACLQLRYVHAYTIQETAEAMGRGPDAIKALAYRATHALHRLLLNEEIAQ